MEKYHKIQTVYKRNPDDKFKTLLMGEWSLPEFGYLADNEWVFTEKVDGTNIRVQYFPGFIIIKGKKDTSKIPVFLMQKLIEMFQTTATIGKFEEIFPGLSGEQGICLYGEGYGPKIQKGGKYRDDPSFVLFDIRIGRWWLKREDVEIIGDKLGIDVVPVIGSGTLEHMVRWAKSGIDSRWGDFLAEGIVARPKTELLGRNGERIITKIKYKDFPGRE